VNVMEALDIAELELHAATSTHGPFHNAHEGFAVLMEEVDELWDEVKKNPSLHPERLARIRVEAKQVAAMALRMLVDLCPSQCPICDDSNNRLPMDGSPCSGCSSKRKFA
jgi:hypothetical protein